MNHRRNISVLFRTFLTCKIIPNTNELNSRYLCSVKDVPPRSTEGPVKSVESIKPIKMSYASYESTKPSLVSKEPPVIIMHGLLGSKGNWNSISKAIHNKTNRKVIAVDARNHGDSPHNPQMSYSHLAVDIKALMADLGIHKATLLGHSMGGRAMMFVALRHPEVVERLIVVDISPVSASPSLSYMRRYFEALRTVNLRPGVPLSAARKLADEHLSKYIKDMGVRQFLITNLVEAEHGQFKWRVNLEALENNFDLIATFPPFSTTFPRSTLFIGGGNSDYLSRVKRSEVRRNFPAAIFKTMPNTNILPHLEKPVQFVDMVSHFLKHSSNRHKRPHITFLPTESK